MQNISADFMEIVVLFRSVPNDHNRYLDLQKVSDKLHIHEVWQKKNETDFFIHKCFHIFSNINVISFKIVPLDSYTQMETLFPLVVAALEVFNQYGLQHVRYTLSYVFL